MADATGRSRRMRYSFETRCRAGTAMLTGLRPGGRGPGGRCRPRDELSLVGRYQADGAPGAPVHTEATAAAPEPGRRGGDTGGAPAQWGGAGHPRGAAGPPRLDGGQGAAAVGALAPPLPPAPPAPPGRALWAGPARGAASPGHQEAGPLLARRQAHSAGRHPAQSPRRLAAGARRQRRPLPAGLRLRLPHQRPPHAGAPRLAAVV